LDVLGCAVAVAAIFGFWWWCSFCEWCARKAGKREANEKWQSCQFELNQWIHSSSFLFPAELIPVIAGPEGAKNLAGKSPPPDSDPF
jgi:hypothetical protein